MEADKERTTPISGGLRSGEAGAFDELYSCVYEELRRLARQQRRQWKGDYTLNTTALVHEVYLKLAVRPDVTWESRSHFMAVAARAMRSLLIDYARQRQAGKRGGAAAKVSFDEQDVPPDDVVVLSEKHTQSLVALDEALKCLEQDNPRWSRGVECRFFGRMTIEDTAVALQVSRNTVKRDWNHAQIWLFRKLRRSLPELGETARRTDLPCNDGRRYPHVFFTLVHG